MCVIQVTDHRGRIVKRGRVLSDHGVSIDSKIVKNNGKNTVVIFDPETKEKIRLKKGDFYRIVDGLKVFINSLIFFIKIEADELVTNK